MLVDEGLFFFRIYRSGTFLFFLVSCLRQLVTPGERDYFLRNESQLMSEHRFMFTDMIDDLFVPVIHLFDLPMSPTIVKATGIAPRRSQASGRRTAAATRARSRRIATCSAPSCHSARCGSARQPR